PAVEVAAQPERARALPGRRLQHGERRRRGVGERPEHLAQMHPLALVPGEVLLRKIHLARRHLEMLRGVFLGRDRDLEALDRAAGLLRLQPQLRARLRAQRDADERDPLVAVAYHQDAIAAEMYARRLLRGAEADPRD